MIYYSSPYSEGKNLGLAYNQFMQLLPEAQDFGCLTDGDTIFTTSDYGHLIGKATRENSPCRLFYALTNRIGCHWQRLPQAPTGDDISIHRQIGKQLAAKFGTRVIERQNEHFPGSGFFILLRRDLWSDLGGFQERGILGVDHDFFRRAVAAKERILQMQGLYLYHWYRGAAPTVGGGRDLRHLLPTPQTRISILNALIDRYGYKSYLEIGVHEGCCFRAINLPKEAKTGVDPTGTSATYKLTSDEFFRKNTLAFDLILIDGCHHANQVYADIVNALACLEPGGTILCHDMLPTNELEQTVPRKTSVWTGDCWKAWVRLRTERDDLFMEVVDVDHGCGIIRRGKQSKIKIEGEIDWYTFLLNKSEWLNLVKIPSH